ncbi:DUF4339 domain-containing protein [Roseiconus lacunae]|uniref:DUF4339 domain-containing protein n=1 Tax=Roseiconus lacunae TaxID=2605694 RepID=A0ABT7PPK3_9BACT|nr:DUF4339 domain-containing protein [Roseiconus lacunae]MDM4018236.1 DUF4339 domain-containing protein [Roseiconus lacunae]
MAAEKSSPEFFLIRGENRIGPLSPRDLKHLATTKQITPKDLIWREGLEDPVPAKTFTALWTPSTESPSQTPELPRAESMTAGEPSDRPEPVSVPILQPKGVRSSGSFCEEPFWSGRVLILIAASSVMGVIHVWVGCRVLWYTVRGMFADDGQVPRALSSGFTSRVWAEHMAADSFLLGFAFAALGVAAVATAIGLPLRKRWGWIAGLLAGGISVGLGFYAFWALHLTIHDFRAMKNSAAAEMITQSPLQADVMNQTIRYTLQMFLFVIAVYGLYSFVAFRNLLRQPLMRAALGGS